MNFFSHQESARKRSKQLVALYALAVVAIVAAVNLLAAAAILWSVQQGSTLQNAPLIDIFQRFSGVFIATTAGTVLVIVCGSLYRLASLRGGGGAVARGLGAVRIDSDTRDVDRRRLMNVVEEIAIASGSPVPEVYVLEREPGINAFAAGYSVNDAAVAVSRGALEHLNRAELQGVIAHEFSHIHNGDMRLNIRIIGLLFGITLIALIGRFLLRTQSGRRSFRSNSNSNNNLPLMLGLGLLVIGGVGLFFGRWIQAAVSRQREYLADASAVQFTRDPQGIGGALKKIMALGAGSEFVEADDEEVEHMLFAAGGLRRMFATHPELVDRIKRIDGTFHRAEISQIAAKMALDDSDEAIEGEPKQSRAEQVRERILENVAAVPVAVAAAGQIAGAPSTGGSPGPDQETLKDSVGTVSWDQVEYARNLKAQLPDALVDGVRDQRHAIDVILALLVYADPQSAEHQLDIVQAVMGHAHREQVLVFLPLVEGLDALHHLPLVELAFPVLKTRPRSALKIYLDVVTRLIRADGQIDYFEYAIARLVAMYLVEALSAPDKRSRSTNIKEARLAIRDLLVILAQAGSDNLEDARRAYLRGWQASGLGEAPEFESIENWPEVADDALNLVDGLRPMFKEAVISAFLATIVHDGKIVREEVELVRAFCASIHVPMPPVISVT